MLSEETVKKIMLLMGLPEGTSPDMSLDRLQGRSVKESVAQMVNLILSKATPNEPVLPPEPPKRRGRRKNPQQGF